MWHVFDIWYFIGGTVFIILYNSFLEQALILSKFYVETKWFDKNAIYGDGFGSHWISYKYTILDKSRSSKKDAVNGMKDNMNSSYFGTADIFGSLSVLVASLLHYWIFMLSDASLGSLQQKENGDDKHEKM